MIENTSMVFAKNLLPPGNLLAQHKSDYIKKCRQNKYTDDMLKGVFFNATIVTESGYKWWGDVDFYKSAENLKQIANTLQEKLYIIGEYDLFNLNQTFSMELYISKARFIVVPTKVDAVQLKINF